MIFQDTILKLKDSTYFTGILKCLYTDVSVLSTEAKNFEQNSKKVNRKESSSAADRIFKIFMAGIKQS